MKAAQSKVTSSQHRWQSEYVRQYQWIAREKEAGAEATSESPWLAHKSPLSFNTNHSKLNHAETSPAELAAASASLSNALHSLEKKQRPLLFANTQPLQYPPGAPDDLYSARPSSSSSSKGGGFKGKIYSASSRKNREVQDPLDATGFPYRPHTSAEKKENPANPWIVSPENPAVHKSYTSAGYTNLQNPHPSIRVDPQETTLASTPALQKQLQSLVNAKNRKKGVAPGVVYSIREEEMMQREHNEPRVGFPERPGAAAPVRRASNSSQGQEVHQQSQSYPQEQLQYQQSRSQYDENELEQQLPEAPEEVEGEDPFVEVDHDDGSFLESQKQQRQLQQQYYQHYKQQQRPPSGRYQPNQPLHPKNAISNYPRPPSALSEPESFRAAVPFKANPQNYINPNLLRPGGRPNQPPPPPIQQQQRLSPKHKELNYDFSAAERVEKLQQQQQQYYQQRKQEYSKQNYEQQQQQQQQEQEDYNNSNNAGDERGVYAESGQYAASEAESFRAAPQTQKQSQRTAKHASFGVNGTSIYRPESAASSQMQSQQFNPKKYGNASSRNNNAQKNNRPPSAQSYTSSQIQNEMDLRYGHYPGDEEHHLNDAEYEEPDSHSQVYQQSSQQPSYEEPTKNSGFLLTPSNTTKKRGLMLMPTTTTFTKRPETAADSYVSEYKREFQDWSWKRQQEMQGIFQKNKEGRNDVVKLLKEGKGKEGKLNKDGWGKEDQMSLPIGNY
ncbi:hypothetical protein HDU99_000052 [Rhizoclosmatium hyalinum]|nr:hypothetical protein HDU99_000052 [Rhizoclosmatium hyalinum]